MSKRCQICGKGPSVGNRVSKSKHRTRRRWLPNLQRKTVQISGRTQKIYICTSCLHSNQLEKIKK
ncbi:50S ribosomal protein L28 [Patescibacteria group bacterium]|nr:50S ribosomal protein L28 [Patescibacteria group bacterium]